MHYFSTYFTSLRKLVDFLTEKAGVMQVWSKMSKRDGTSLQALESVTVT